MKPHTLLFALLIAFTLSAAASGEQRPNQRQHAIAITDELKSVGVVYRAEGLQLWIDPDGLDYSEVAEFVGLMEQGGAGGAPAPGWTAGCCRG